MTVSIGLFTSMTRVVRHEQKPAESLIEARVAVLKTCRRVRNCRQIVSPKFDKLLAGQRANSILLRDRVLRRTVRIQVENGILTETHYPLDYDPQASTQAKPIKAVRLAACRSFQITSGGFQHPTRVNISFEMLDQHIIHGTTNFREAI